MGHGADIGGRCTTVQSFAGLWSKAERPSPAHRAPVVSLPRFRFAMHTGNLSSQPAKSAVKGTVFVHLDFVLAGVVMTLLGPMLPVLSARWMINDTQAGYLFVDQFVTSMLGMAASGTLVERYGYRRTLIAGLILMAAGMAMLAHANWPLGLMAVLIFGVGFGLTTPAANLFIAQANPEGRASALNLLNSSWGVGAMGCPLIVAAAQRSHRGAFFLYGMAMALLALAVSLAVVRFRVDREQVVVRRNPGRTASIWNNRLVPLVTALFFIYVGTETSVGGWVASYAHRMDTGGHAFWAMTPSFFWGAMLAGRMLASWLLRHMRETTMACAGLTLASLGVVTLLAAHSMALIVLGAVLAGLGLASIYPINISLLPHWFGEAATSVSGVIFSISNLGGAALPWMVGALSTHFGSLRVGFLVPLLSSIIMLVAYIVLHGKQHRSSPQPV